MKNVVVVTGASSGFGALAAHALARGGHTVYASMRETTGRNAPQVKEVEKYAAEHGVDLRAIELDVSSQESTDAAIKTIIFENGRLDVVIHNAGHMVFGPAEAFTPEQLAQLYDTNVLSTQRVNRTALPHLRAQGKGLVVWVSSSSARGGILVLSCIRHELLRQIMLFLLQHDVCTLNDFVRFTNKAPLTLSVHLKHLEESGLISADRKDSCLLYALLTGNWSPTLC